MSSLQSPSRVCVCSQCSYLFSFPLFVLSLVCPLLVLLFGVCLFTFVRHVPQNSVSFRVRPCLHRYSVLGPSSVMVLGCHDRPPLIVCSRAPSVFIISRPVGAFSFSPLFRCGVSWCAPARAGPIMLSPFSGVLLHHRTLRPALVRSFARFFLPLDSPSVSPSLPFRVAGSAQL